ncbi:MAG: adenylate/guanylate cyclase domain-containing protein [Vicinamibacterales bacterium]
MLSLRGLVGGVERSYDLAPGTFVVGRLSSCDLVIDDATVSRHHARLRVTDAGASIADAGSRYGTFLNGRRVKFEDVAVRPGDELKLGEVRLVMGQRVAEADLLSEDHEVSEGPGTICLPLAAAGEADAGARGGVLRLIADVGRTLLGSRSAGDVLAHVVDRAFEAVPAERAFLMLCEPDDEALTARVLRHRDGTVPDKPTISRAVVRRVMRDRVAILAADAAHDPRLGPTDSIARFNIRAFLCAPIWNRDEVIGVLYVDSPRAGCFRADHLDAFAALANAAAVAIEQARLTGQLVEEQRRRERLQRYHSPAVVSRILESTSPDGTEAAQERDVTVLFCDLVGFTAICQDMPAVEAATLLNAFLTEMSDVVFDHEGTLDKFMGDALLAVFGAPFDQPDHAVKAVQAACVMRRALADLNARREGPPLEMRVAINTGPAVTGDIGSPRRREFTVLGDTVNTVARLEDEVAAPGDIVISGETLGRLGGRVAVRPLGARTLRGRGAPLEVYAVLD